jgi:serine/threonine-protein kinase
MKEIFPRLFNENYEILDMFGCRIAGVLVYKARQIEIGRIVVLKVLEAICDNDSEERFIREIKVMKDLNHKNLATILDFGKHEDKLFMAMAFVEGEPLSNVLKKKKIFGIEETISIALQIAQGLEYAHKLGVIHRDIKPLNIVVKNSGEICIIDFSISITENSLRLTSPNKTMGTPEYMSPEQCTNKEITLQSDIYNFGILLYEMLSGEPPFTGSAPFAILNMHQNEKPKPLSKKNKNVPAELESIINKCLEKDTAYRYANFAEVEKDLKRLTP